VTAPAATSATGQSASRGPLTMLSPRRRFGRRKWDHQPTQQTAVLIASTGDPVPAKTVRQALRLSQGKPVAVVSIVRIYGSSLGLPNPGLLPTQKEMTTQRDQVAKVVAALERGGAEGWGQVAATRRPGRTIARVAEARGARHVLVVTPDAAKWRRVVEGDVVKEIQRRLGPHVVVEGG